MGILNRKYEHSSLEFSNNHNNLDKEYADELRKIIKPEQYHEFTNILIEIMLRRQREFNRPKEVLIKEAHNLVKHLKKIDFIPAKKLGNPSWAAQQVPSTFRIEISIEYAKYVLKFNSNREILEALYQLLTHEVYHAIATNDQFESGFFTNWFNSRGLNELLNECAANRASRNSSAYDFNTKIRHTYSYSNLTICSPLIARAFGVTEKELLANGTLENARFHILELITKDMHKPNESLDDKIRIQAENFIKTLSEQIDILHNLDIPMDASQVIADSQKPIFRQETLTSMFNNLIQLTSFRIQQDTRPITSDLVAEYAYSYKGIIGYVNQILQEYVNGSLISKQQADIIKNNTKLQLEELCNRILGLRAVTIAMGNKNTDQSSISNMLSLAKKGYLISSSKCANHYGVTLPQNKFFEIYNIDTSRQHYKVLHTDFPINYWSNYEVEDEMLHILRKNSGIRGKFNKAANFIRDLLNKQKKLPAAQTQQSSLEANRHAYSVMVNNIPEQFEKLMAKYTRHNNPNHQKNKLKNTRDQNNPLTNETLPEL